MLRRLLAAALMASLLPLGGCAWLLGYSEVPQPASPVRVTAPLAMATNGRVRLTAHFLGVGERMVSEHNLWGRAARVVDPYGEDSFVIDVMLDNQGHDDLVVQPQAATLQIGTAAPLKTRSLDDYRKRWPTWPVSTQDEGTDQAFAYKQVLDTLLLERLVHAGESVNGRLAFPAEHGSGPMSLKLPYKVGGDRKEVVAVWEAQ
jgi:hypothetical protein